MVFENSNQLVLKSDLKTKLNTSLPDGSLDLVDFTNSVFKDSSLRETMDKLFDNITKYISFKNTLVDRVEWDSPFGFYVNVFANLMESFETIGYTLLLFVILYYFFTVLSTIVINKLFPDKASQNSSPISSTKIAALAVVFVLGFLTVESDVYYNYMEDGKLQEGKVKTTIAKDFMTFLAEKGDYLSTGLSDKLFEEYTAFSYLKSINKIREIFGPLDVN